jgi:hypothetical protein
VKPQAKRDELRQLRGIVSTCGSPVNQDTDFCQTMFVPACRRQPGDAWLDLTPALDQFPGRHVNRRASKGAKTTIKSSNIDAIAGPDLDSTDEFQSKDCLPHRCPADTCIGRDIPVTRQPVTRHVLALGDRRKNLLSYVDVPAARGGNPPELGTLV